MSDRVYINSLFIFRRDLRINDNTGLLQALAQSGRVLPCFILDPRQIEPHPYQSRPALKFMRQSLLDLDQALQKYGTHLNVYHGLPTEVLRSLVAKFSLQAVFVNRDYTPFSRRRDEDIAQVCRELNVDFISCPDLLLTEPEQVLRANRQPYQVFTAFYNSARQYLVEKPAKVNKYDFTADQDAKIIDSQLPDSGLIKDEDGIAGGREAALKILSQLLEQANYMATRDFPGLASTTNLSAHLKFGTVSVREVYWSIKDTLGGEHPLLRQLYWRDFFTHIAFHFPHVFGKTFQDRFNKLHWENNLADFKCWCTGMTGFPIVDAGMRELNATGFMHNRVRMITASFLVKDMHISWRWGERYFAQRLVDYDPAVNNGNWQWAASTGCDAQPYFRIFNPWLQQVKFDPDCIYIKRWLPELRAVPHSVIHAWHDRHSSNISYPPPMLEHAAESKLAKERFQQAANLSQ